MPSPGGQEVGRVSIRVVPDTSKFRRELERDLKAIQRGVELKIPVELDMKSALSQIAKIKAALKGLSGGKVSVDTDIVETVKKTTVHARTLRGLLSNMKGDVNTLGKGFRNILNPVKAAAASVKNFRNEVTQIKNTRLEKGTTSQFFKNLRKEAFLSEKQLGRVRTTVGGLGSNLQVLGRRGVSGIKALGRGVADMDTSFRRSRRNVTIFAKTLTTGLSVLGKGLMSPITALTKGLGGLSRVGLIVTAVLAAIPPIVGLIGGLLAGLPSLLLAFGAAAGVVALGWDGIKKAAEGFSTAIEPLKGQISAIFEKGLAPQFTALGNALVKLGPQLQQVAQGIVNMAQGFTNAITSAEGMKNLNIILQNTGKFFSALKGPIQTSTEGLLMFAAEGSKHFGLLVGVIQRFADAWKEIASRADFPDRMKAAMEGLAKVTDALLQGFVKLVDSGISVMAQLGTPLAHALTVLIDLIVAMMPALTGFSTVILQVVSVLSETLIPIFKSLAPLFDMFFQQIAGLLIPIIQALGPPFQMLVEFVLKLFQAFTPLFPVLTTIAELLGSLLMTALKALEPVLPVIASSMAQVANVINTALKAAEPILQKIAGALGDAIVAAVNALAPILPGLIDAFLKLVVAVLPLLPPLIELIGQILPPLIKVLNTLIIPIVEVATRFTNWLMPALTSIIRVVGDVINFLGKIAGGLAEAGAGIIRWFADLPGKIWNFVKDAGNWLFNTGKNLIVGLWNGVVKIWNDFMNWIGDNFNSLIDWVGDILGIGSPSKIFRQYGVWLMEGLEIGVNKGAPDALKAAEDAARQMTNIGSTMSAEVSANGGVEYVHTGIGAQVADALSGWQVKLDRNGMASLVNEANRKNRTGRLG